MFEMMVSPPMVTKSGTLSTTASMSEFDILGKPAFKTRRLAIRPLNATRAAEDDFA